MTKPTRDRAEAPAHLKGYSVTMWEATGRTDAELDLIEGFVMDMNGGTLCHLPRAEMLRDARAAEKLLVSFGDIAAVQS